MFSNENTPLKDKSVVLIAGPADYADGNIYPEIYSLKKSELLCLSVNFAIGGAKETIKETKVKKLNLLC